MIKKIEKDINKRMSEYTDSRHPADDEVAITWLVSEVRRLEEVITRYMPKPYRSEVFSKPE